MSALGETLQFLRNRGFRRIASPKPEIRIFDGPLRVSADVVPVRLEIEDWDFLSYPRISIRNPPAFLPSPMGHIDAIGGLCYLTEGSVVLDRYAPAGALAFCLEKAEQLLERLVTSPGGVGNDIRDEFLAYWGGGAKGLLALIGHIGAKATVAQCSIVELPPERLGGVRLTVISSGQAEVENLARSVSGNVSRRQYCPCWIFRSDVPPVEPEGRLPTTISEAFKYLKRWDTNLSKAIQRMLGSDSEYLKFGSVLIAIHSPAGWLGFSFELNRVLAKGFRKSPTNYRQYLHTKGASTAISRMTLLEFGTDFIHARNLNSPTLAGKHVIVVGSGSLGGYLAQSLARLGAGALGGVMRLIDPETLAPENVGRHWLGMSALFLPKAKAVASELQRQFPESKFEAELADVRDSRELFAADLIVDATGIEALSEALNDSHCRRRKLPKAPPPTLHVWVLGNGDAVQGLWVDSHKFGCYRCLRLPRGDHYRQERFPVLNRVPEVRLVGCSEFRPYAVAAPMSAAALATDFIVDWLKGDPSPRFRTRPREGADVRKQKSQDFEPTRECPACNP